MWVISKKKVFFQQDVPVDPKDKIAAEKVEPPFLVEPNIEDLTRPVEAPDWIKQTEFYKLLRKEGSIQESADAPVDNRKEEEEPHKAKTGLPYPAKK